MKKSRSLVLSIFFLVLIFVIVGVLIVYDVSIAESLAIYGDKFFVARGQALRAGIGLAGLLVAWKIPSKLWTKLGAFIFFLSIIMLVLVLIPGIGMEISGARRWISLWAFPFQPSELVKIGLIFYLSIWLVKPRRFLSFLMIIGAIFGLVMLEPDLGSSLVLVTIATTIYFVSGKPLKHLAWFFGIGFMGILLLILTSPYRLQRLVTYLNPDIDPQGKSYHIRQITIALGNGGIFGQGIGKSRQKYQYIPEAMTDSIFAIVAEELGFVGCGMIIIGYMALFTMMIGRITQLKMMGEKLLGTGIATWVAAQALVNLGSVTALIPLTGVPLPFISYGGSSLIMMLVGMGVFLSLGNSESKRI